MGGDSLVFGIRPFLSRLHIHKMTVPLQETLFLLHTLLPHRPTASRRPRGHRLGWLRRAASEFGRLRGLHRCRTATRAEQEAGVPEFRILQASPEGLDVLRLLREGFFDPRGDDQGYQGLSGAPPTGVGLDVRASFFDPTRDLAQGILTHQQAVGVSCTDLSIGCVMVQQQQDGWGRQ